MRLLIEKYGYPPSVLDDLEIPDDWRFTDKEGTQSIEKVGYFRATATQEPVFVLPKIFEKKGKVFGEIDIVDLASLATPDVFKKHPEGQRYLEWLYRFSMSLYLSLRTYRRRNPDTVIANKTHFRNIVANTPDDETTELELVLNILEFYRNNHDLIVFTEKQNQSQHFRKTNWAKTIRIQQPVFTANKEPVYLTTVEKQRHRNDDDELLKILYSVLRHFKTQYGFRIDAQTSLALYDKIDTPSVSTQLVRRLKGLKNVYFADRFRKLLHLLLLYFQRTSEARTQQGGKEYLLCHDYHHVFEDMVDALLSDEAMDDKLKYQSDGKIVDHLFRHQSLFAPDDIWYIGDSKYYKADRVTDEKSIYKQHTYAKNIIQYNINLFNNKDPEAKGRYRDVLTEGYNVSPNFFIQAFVHHDDLFKMDDEFKFEHETAPYLNHHFENRLFDRDTLSIHHFKINFLFVLRSYITQDSGQRQAFKSSAIQTIRTSVLMFYNQKYEFHTLTFVDRQSLEAFVRTHFKDLNGKIYQTSVDDKLLWLALSNDKEHALENTTIKDLCQKRMAGNELMAMMSKVLI
jgi:hypothetical protein